MSLFTTKTDYGKCADEYNTQPKGHLVYFTCKVVTRSDGGPYVNKGIAGALDHVQFAHHIVIKVPEMGSSL